MAPPAKRSWKANLLLVVVIGLVLVVAHTLSGRLQAPALPKMAPAFALPTLDGETVRLAELRGKTVVLNFWASWCGPCKMETPSLAAFAEDHPEIAVLGIAIDGEAEELRGVKEDWGISYPVLLADEATRAAYRVRGIPNTVVVNPDGSVRTSHVGVLFRPQLWWMTR